MSWRHSTAVLARNNPRGGRSLASASSIPFPPVLPATINPSLKRCATFLRPAQPRAQVSYAAWTIGWSDPSACAVDFGSPDSSSWRAGADEGPAHLPPPSDLGGRLHQPAYWVQSHQERGEVRARMTYVLCHHFGKRWRGMAAPPVPVPPPHTPARTPAQPRAVGGSASIPHLVGAADSRLQTAAPKPPAFFSRWREKTPIQLNLLLGNCITL